MVQDKILIRTQNLKKEYKIANSVITALKGISLEIAEKKFSLLYGPSGSGKTTLLNLIGLIDFPTKGEVFIDGVDMAELKRSKLSEFRLKNIGFIFQKFYLFEELTSVENVFLPAVAKDGFSRHILKKSEHLLDLVGLKERLHHKPRHLSEGERQRVAIARSLINEPRILLCDEPTASIDDENGKVVLDILARINSEKGVTVFLVTHDERQLSYADNVFYINNGLILEKADSPPGR